MPNSIGKGLKQLGTVTTIFTAVAALAVGLSGGLGAVFASSAIIKSAAVDVGLKASGAALDKA